MHQGSQDRGRTAKSVAPFQGARTVPETALARWPNQASGAVAITVV